MSAEPYGTRLRLKDGSLNVTGAPASETDLDPVVSAETGIVCEWFARCDREVVRAALHPALGWVPICERCIGKIEDMGETLHLVNVEVVAS